MSSFEDFLEGLSPSVKKEVQLARDFETVRYPYASLGLTLATAGGLGAGRMHLIYGNPSAGKSMLALQTIAKLQKEYGLVCGYADVEATFDRDFSSKLGVNNDELLIATSRSSGRLSDTIMPWIEGGIDLIVVDSISDILPESQVDKDGTIKGADDRRQIGAQSKAVTNLINGIHYSNKKTAVILLSQTTTEIGTVFTRQVPTSGKKVTFASSQMIRLQSSNTNNEQIKELVQVGDNTFEKPVGRHVNAIVEKNKMGAQLRTATWDIYYDGAQLGIDLVDETIRLAVEYGVIEKLNIRSHEYQGTKWTSYGQMVDAIKFDVDMRRQIEKELENKVA